MIEYMNQKKQTKAMNYLRICMRSIRLAWKFSPSIFGVHFIVKVVQSLMGYVQIGILGLIVDGLIKLTVNQNITNTTD